jgi:hypothetical protein
LDRELRDRVDPLHCQEVEEEPATNMTTAERRMAAVARAASGAVPHGLASLALWQDALLYFARPVKPCAIVGIAMIALRALGVPHVP